MQLCLNHSIRNNGIMEIVELPKSEIVQIA